MRPKVRKLILCLFIFMHIMLTFSTVFAHGVDIPETKEDTFVYDTEGVLTNEEFENLNCILRYVEKNTSVEFAVITTKSFNGISINDYAHDLFNELGIGKSDKDNGILLLFSANEGHAKFEFGYGLEHIFSEALVGRILDDYYVPNREAGRQVEAITQSVNAILEILGKEYNVELVENQEDIIKSIKEEDRLVEIIQFIILIILLAFSVYVEIRSGGSGSGSSYHSSYHGGGFSSGSSFGGGHSGGAGPGR